MPFCPRRLASHRHRLGSARPACLMRRAGETRTTSRPTNHQPTNHQPTHQQQRCRARDAYAPACIAAGLPLVLVMFLCFVEACASNCEPPRVRMRACVHVSAHATGCLEWLVCLRLPAASSPTPPKTNHSLSCHCLLFLCRPVECCRPRRIAAASLPRLTLPDLPSAATPRIAPPPNTQLRPCPRRPHEAMGERDSQSETLRTPRQAD